MVNFCVYDTSLTSLQHSVSCLATCRLDVDVLYNQEYAERTYLS